MRFCSLKVQNLVLEIDLGNRPTVILFIMVTESNLVSFWKHLLFLKGFFSGNTKVDLYIFSFLGLMVLWIGSLAKVRRKLISIKYATTPLLSPVGGCLCV